MDSNLINIKIQKCYAIKKLQNIKVNQNRNNNNNNNSNKVKLAKKGAAIDLISLRNNQLENKFKNIKIQFRIFRQ